MTRPNRYDDVADLYDHYVDVESDLDFFRAFAEEVNGPILDLMAGTGRVSLAIAGGGNWVIALERSEAMLGKLVQNAGSLVKRVSPLCADARDIPLKEEAVDLALLPFNSFSELLTNEDQTSALRDIARCLTSGGHFIGTLHNPRIRARSLDGEQRLERRRPLPSSSGKFLELWVEGTLDEKTKIAESEQLLQIVDESADVLRETRQYVRFMLLEPEDFVQMAERVGLRQVESFGSYDRTPFEPKASPYFISVFEKRREEI